MKILTKKIFLILSIIFGLIACGDDSDIPADIIDEQTMSKILADIHILESKASRLSFQAYDSTKVAYNEKERLIMIKYKIDTTRYKASYKFYMTNPENMVRIYDETLKILKEMEDKKKEENKKNR